jgi:Flp pilus assembly pilin Flp
MIRFLTDETGLELTEYAVAAALVAVTVVATFMTLGEVISLKIEDLASRISE